jgi:hypothetical protein
VVDSFALLTRSAATQTGHDLALGQFIAHHGGQPQPIFVQELFQRDRLCRCPRESIEDEPARTVQAYSAFLDQVPNGRIGHQFTPAHVSQGLLHGRAEFAFAPGCRRSENITSRQMAGKQPLVQEIGLGTLADAGCTEQDNPPRQKLPVWDGFASTRRTLQPGSARRLIRDSHGLTVGPPA